MIMMTLSSKMHAYGDMLTIPLSPKRLRRGNLCDSIETKNVRLFTFVSSIKITKLVVSLRFDLCHFDIGCSNAHLSTHLSVEPSDES